MRESNYGVGVIATIFSIIVKMSEKSLTKAKTQKDMSDYGIELHILNQRLTCCQFPIAKSATGADCPNFCLMPPCQSGAMCPDTYDSNGCLMPPTCSPNIAPCGEFPSWEQVVKACPKSQYDSYGCEVNPGNLTLSDKTFSAVRNQRPLTTYF